MRSDCVLRVTRLAAGLALSLCVLVTTSCFAIRNDYQGDRLMTPGTTLLRPSEAVGVVEVSEYKWSCLFGFVDLESSSGVEMLEHRALECGLVFDGMTQVRVRDEMDLWTIVVTGLTLGLFTPWYVEGDAIAERFVAARDVVTADEGR